MYCGISGETPREPVLARTSGQIYERSLIEQYIASNGKCPITGEPLSVDDLISVNASKIVKPRPTAATSIPGMLQLFQNEWDSQMLETFNLKQQLDATRQELAHALYQNDAARRVIARLIRERDEARSLLANAGANGASIAPNGGAPVDRELTPAILERMQRLQSELLKSRKTRPCNVLPKETVQSFQQKNSWPLHQTTEPGITCLAIHPSRKQHVATGGVDKTVILYDRVAEKKVATLTGHSKKVNRVVFHPLEDVLISASDDKTVRVWTPAPGGFRAAHVISHAAAVTGLSLHPLGDYALSASQNGSWAIHDIHTGITLNQTNDPAGAAYTAASFHPDGLLLGTGDANGVVRVWDVKSQEVITSFDDHAGPVQFAFSENGYHMLAASSDNIKLWDVRKPKPIKSYDFAPGFGATSIDVDYSATYVAVGGEAVRVLAVKTLEPVVAFEGHKKTATDVKWTRDSTELASVSLDRSLAFYSA